MAGLSKISAEDLVNCPNCIVSGFVQVPAKDRALHESKPCPDCKGKKKVSADRAKAIQRSIDKSASSARGSRTAVERWDTILLQKRIPDLLEEKFVPKGQYIVTMTKANEVALREYSNPTKGYLVDATVLAKALA